MTERVCQRRRDCAPWGILSAHAGLVFRAAFLATLFCSHLAAQVPDNPESIFSSGESSLFPGMASAARDGSEKDSKSSNPASPIRTAEAKESEASPRPGTIRQQSFTSRDINELLREPIAEVRIEGNRTIPTYRIAKIITHTRVGRPVIAEQIRQDKTALLKTRWFLSVRERVEPTDNGPVVVFEVMESPILRKVEFHGNKKFSDEKLHRETGLVPGHGFDVSANHESVARIREMYREKGYIHAKVELRKGGDPNDREVIIVIDEGPKVVITDIDFEGNRSIRSAILKTKLSTKAQWLMLFGGKYNPELIQNDILVLRNYYEGLGYFDVEIEAKEQVSPDGGRVRVIFQINEGPHGRYTVRNIDTSGNAVLSREVLLQNLKLKPGDKFNSRLLQADAQAMKLKYDELGRPFAVVQPTPRFLMDQPGMLDIVYQIDEDKVWKIGRININIRGDYTHTKTSVFRHRINKYLKPGQLARASDLQAARIALSSDPIVDKEDPPQFDIQRVSGEDYLPPRAVTRGQDLPEPFQVNKTRFFSARVMEAPRSRPTTGSLWLQPGIEGLFPTPPPRQKKPAPLDPRPSRVLPEQPSPNAEEITPADPAMSHVPSPRPLPMLAYRHRRPSESEQQTEEPTEGNPIQKSETAESSTMTIPPDIVFRGQSAGYPGTASYPPVMIAQQPPGYRAQSVDPYGLPRPQNYLQGVSPQGNPYGNGVRGPIDVPNYLDINIDATEGRTGRLMFGAGVNSDAGVVGSLVLQEDNFDILGFPRHWGDIAQGRAFRGNGESFRIELVPGSQVSRYSGSWRHPYFMGTDFSLGIDGFYYNRFFENWTEDRQGGRVSLGYIINRYWSVGTTVRLENVNFRDFLVVPTTPALYTRVAGNNFLSTVQLRIAYDTRDSAFLPSKGHNIEFAYEQAFGEFTYPRFDLSGSQYFTIYERPDGQGKHILQFRGQATWTGNDTPVFERLYAGGFQTFRGFEFRGITPRQSSFRIGGDYMLLGTVEYVFPITAGDGLRGVVFSDMGTVDDDISRNGLDHFRVSAGFGLRITVPAMGPAPIALDWTWPILNESFDDTQVFSFYVGTTF